MKELEIAGQKKSKASAICPALRYASAADERGIMQFFLQCADAI